MFSDAITEKEARLIDTPEGMARVLWYRLWRNLRLAHRAECARIEQEILYGNPAAKPVTGILNAHSKPLNNDHEDDGA